MSGYAHPIKDADGLTIAWCNEDAKEVAKLPPQPHDEVLPEHQEEIDKARASVRPPIAKSTNDSIEAQVAQKGGIEILKVLIEQKLLTDKEIEKCKEYAMFSIQWAMGRIDYHQ